MYVQTQPDELTHNTTEVLLKIYWFSYLKFHISILRSLHHSRLSLSTDKHSNISITPK